MTRQLCIENITDPESLEALLACRLIPLDKCPGIRPIGIGEVLRRIMGKAVMSILRPDVLKSTGYQQMCAGQEAGCEVAIHAVRDLYDLDSTHGFIQIDASNAFNSINRNVLLHNIKIICPQIATYVTNCYNKPARLFITGGKEIQSTEGTTQGDPIAMGMYALGLMPLLTSITTPETNNLVQIAFADDLTGVGTLNELEHWWENILKYGPYLGYNVNESKSWLITKPNHLQQAKEIFASSTMEITSDGHKHLGAVVGTTENKENYVTDKVITWIEEVNKLSEIACTQPHAAYSAFIHGLRHRFTYTMRTIPDIAHLLKPLDAAIDNFIRVLFQGYLFNSNERILLSLPARLGGMAIIIPSEISQNEYDNSRNITNDTITKVKSKEIIFEETKNQTTAIKSQIRAKNRNAQRKSLDEIKLKTTIKSKLRSIEASCESGASMWLTVLPIKQHGFFLEKQAFWDAIRIRYGIPLNKLPSQCVCGCPFSLQHAFSCPKGGFIITRHNEVRDLTAEILNEVCSQVSVEPTLTPLTGEEFRQASVIKTDNARADICARSFWIKGQTAYCDVRVFNPLANCYMNQSLSAAHKKNEAEKKRQYNQRILQVEQGSFTPLVFSCFGGFSRECNRFFSHAAEQIATKRKISKSLVVSWMKSRLNFALLRSCLLCIRGTRTSTNFNALNETDVRQVALESHIKDDYT